VATNALSEHDAEQWIFHRAFSTSVVGQMGLELEWLVRDGADATIRVRPEAVLAAIGSEPGSVLVGRLSFEPGGQCELSTPPAPSLGSCLRVAAADVTTIRRLLGLANLRLVGSGLDSRPARRVVASPRYATLESHYRRFGGAGDLMMCNTASVQVNIDAGDDSDGWRGRQRRWWLANSLGPILIAMFANSPRSDHATGKSCRQVLRFQTDPSRTDPLPLTGDCREKWTGYALAARVTGVGQEDGSWTDAPEGMTMRQWLRGAGPRPATLRDLQRHLKAVIPPVRACGHLEVRMIDAQAGDDWAVPAVVVGALLDDEQASDRAVDIVSKLPSPERRDDWTAAARYGLARPELAAAAQACMGIVCEAMPRLDLPAWTRDTVERFAERYTDRGLCPADLRYEG
jgi:glutamate--cysteine ligase